MIKKKYHLCVLLTIQVFVRLEVCLHSSTANIMYVLLFFPSLTRSFTRKLLLGKYQIFNSKEVWYS